MSEVSQILSAIEQGDPEAAHELLPLVYEELRKLAAAKLAREGAGQTLQATALVHDAFLRLVGQGRDWDGRNHFFAAAAEAMRRILVDSARSRLAAKRGGGMAKVPLSAFDPPEASPSDEVVAVHDALDALAMADPVAAELVKLHYFAGFSIAEAAELLDISRANAYRLWSYARSWLRADILESKFSDD